MAWNSYEILLQSDTNLLTTVKALKAGQSSLQNKEI